MGPQKPSPYINFKALSKIRGAMPPANYGTQQWALTMRRLNYAEMIAI